MASLREQSKLLGVTVDAIKTIENFVDNYDAEVDQDKIDSRLNRLNTLYDRFVATSIAVELLTEEKSETKATFLKTRNEMEDKYYALYDFLTAHKLNRQVSVNTPHVSTSVVRLPKIDLPTFDGEIDNWIPFHDAYRSLIHKNKDLDAVDKFHYLMTVLKGPAKKLLETTSVTAANYKIAWDILVSRYDNKRLLIKSHITSLFSIEPVRKESAATILALVDQFERHVKILTTLGEQTEQWSSLLVHMVCSLLDQTTLREWEKSTVNDKEKLPTYKELINFLKDQARILLSLDCGNIAYTSQKDNPRALVAHTACILESSSPKSFSCTVCMQQHRIYDCNTFKQMQLKEKQNIVRKKKLCWNCLSSSHLSQNCSSKFCRKCNSKHHTLLHSPTPNGRSTQHQAKPPIGNQRSTSVTVSATQQPLNNPASSASSSKVSYPTTLFATAVVKVHGSSGKSSFVRALLDSGSEANFITEDVVRSLGLQCIQRAAVITGMGGSTVDSRYCTEATIASADSSYKHNLKFCVLPTITNDLPSKPVDTSHWSIPSNLLLADPEFSTPQKIDIVIGAELFFHLLRDGQILLGDGTVRSQPILQRTVFGWIVSGQISNGISSAEHKGVSLMCSVAMQHSHTTESLPVVASNLRCDSLPSTKFESGRNANTNFFTFVPWMSTTETNRVLVHSQQPHQGRSHVPNGGRHG